MVVANSYPGNSYHFNHYSTIAWCWLKSSWMRADGSMWPTDVNTENFFFMFDTQQSSIFVLEISKKIKILIMFTVIQGAIQRATSKIGDVELRRKVVNCLTDVMHNRANMSVAHQTHFQVFPLCIIQMLIKCRLIFQLVISNCVNFINIFNWICFLAVVFIIYWKLLHILKLFKLFYLFYARIFRHCAETIQRKFFVHLFKLTNNLFLLSPRLCRDEARQLLIHLLGEEKCDKRLKPHLKSDTTFEQLKRIVDSFKNVRFLIFKFYYAA